MQLEAVVTKLIKFMKARSEALALSVTSGSIDSMEKYRYIIGQIAALEAVLQELSNPVSYTHLTLPTICSV